MKVFVTGGRGLLGAAVVAELVARGHEVTAYQRHPSESLARDVIGDITDPEGLSAAIVGHDAVVHMAALVSVVGPWAEFERVNVEGTRNVIEAARATGVHRLVMVSSPSVAHSGRALVGATAGPADPERARGNYARSKALAEQEALAADSADLAVTAVRPHLVWGPGDAQLIEPIVQRARAGRLVLIDGGMALIDTTYVDNAASAIAQALERCEREEVRGCAFVVSNGEPRTVAEILTRIADAAGITEHPRSVPFAAAMAAGAVAERTWALAGRTDVPPLTPFLVEQLATAHWFDQRQARAALDWEPTVSLSEGFARLGRSLRA